MNTAGTKRERLLDWIRNGDPQEVPVLLSSPHAVAASVLGKDEGQVSWAEATRIAEETETHSIANLGMPMSFDVPRFLDDVTLTDDTESLPDGGRRRTRVIETPEGTLREIIEAPKDMPSGHREFFVKGDADLPAFASFIRKTSEGAIRNPAVRRHVDEQMTARNEEIHGVFPTRMFCYVPAVELTSSWYMDQATTIYTLADHRSLMEELMDCHWRMMQVWLELAADNHADIYFYAVNGLEWLSPDLYERYMIPQALRINEFAAAHGKLSWIHTCGKLKKLAETGVYQRMKVSVMESLSTPPTGDIDDLAETRRHIGPDIATRGGINVEYFYEDDPGKLKSQAEYVLDSTAGYRHMIGDTDDSYPAYPWRNIQTLIETVRSRGQLFV